MQSWNHLESTPAPAPTPAPSITITPDDLFDNGYFNISNDHIYSSTGSERNQRLKIYTWLAIQRSNPKIKLRFGPTSLEQLEVPNLKSLDLQNVGSISSVAINIAIPNYPFLESLDITHSNRNDIDFFLLCHHPKLINLACLHCYLTQATVDLILIEFDNSQKTNGTLNLLGWGTSANASPSSAGEAAKTSLINKGWSVITN